MIQEPPAQLACASQSSGDEPTEPRIVAHQRPTSPPASVLQVRRNASFSVSIDEQGTVIVGLADRDDLIWGPEEAFDLLDFLFAHRNLLAARSAESAEGLDEPHHKQ